MTHPTESPTESPSRTDTLTRNPLAGGTDYQRARLNFFIEPSQRHQLDALSVEWNCTLTEVLRRIINRGMRGIMLDLSTE